MAHSDGTGTPNYGLDKRDAALVTMRSQGLSLKAIGGMHSITRGQVSKRLSGRGGGGPYPPTWRVRCAGLSEGTRKGALK